MSDEMQYGKRDTLTGMRWVYVSRAAAHSHPMGKMHWSFWLVAVWLFITAVSKFRLGVEIAGVWFGVAAAFLPVFIGGLVLLRAPIARVLLIALGAFTVYTTVKGGGLQAGFPALANMLILIGVTIWMWEGERPNLAFGYRFRSLKSDAEVADG